MKKIILIINLVAATLVAFAQGKVQVQNDGTRLVTLIADTASVEPADVGLAGQPVPVAGPLPSGISLVFGLYAGTSSTSLSLVSAYPINPPGGNPGSIVTGQIASSHCILPFPGGSVDYFLVKVWDGAYASYEAEAAASKRDYSGIGSFIFTMTPGTGIAYPGINNGGGTTWTTGPIVVFEFPEPSAMALATVALVTAVLRRSIQRG